MHGGLVLHIELGIRIGQDSLHSLNAKRWGVNVSVTDSKNAPCTCVADGLMVATSASPGYKILTVNAKSPDTNYLALIEVTMRSADVVVSYRMPFNAIDPLAKVNYRKSSRQRFDAIFATLKCQFYELVSRWG